jgi:hypothetical protein
MWPDGAGVVKAADEGGCNDEDDNDDKEDDRTSTDSSADFGRCPKRSSGFRLAANSFAIDQWEHLLHLGDVSTQDVKVDLDDDRRPRWDAASPTTKKEWKSTISTMKRTASALTEPVALAPFRASLFFTCLLHAEADLKPKKAFKEATLSTGAAGACGLALVRCGELAYAALGKESTLMQRMKDACLGESPQDVDSLLSILRDSHEELGEVRFGDFEDLQRRFQGRRWSLQPRHRRSAPLGL